MTRKLLLATTLRLPVSVAPTAAVRPMKTEDFAKLEWVGTISVSPDGSRG